MKFYFRDTLTKLCKSCEGQDLAPWHWYLIVATFLLVLAFPVYIAYGLVKERIEKFMKQLIENCTVVFFTVQVSRTIK